MKSLEQRLADRANRKETATEQTAERARILAEGTLAARSEHLRDAAGNGEETESEYTDMTVGELKAELDTRELEYKASAKKDELIALLEEDDAAA